MNPRPRPILVIAVTTGVVLLAGAALMGRFGPGKKADGAPGAARGERLPSLDAAAGWINGGPLTEDSLRGHVTVLVQWSDTDPRSLDVLPEVEGWHLAFRRYGVRVIGVHVPDYTFGADREVTVRAVQRLALTLPIAHDPQYRIRLPGDGRRPTITLADTTGRIVLTADGDHLPDVDRAIRAQVRALHPEVGFPLEAEGEPSAVPAAATPETRFSFLGTARAARGPIADSQPGRTVTFTAQFRFQEEGEPFVPYPVGRWTPSAEGLTAARGGAMNYVAIRCGAGRVSVVMSPPPGGSSRVWILQDDAWLGERERDDDVRLDPSGGSYVDVTEPRLYRIARLANQRVLKLSPEDGGVMMYAFALEPEKREIGIGIPETIGAAARGNR